MNNYCGGQDVKSGFYFNVVDWKLETVSGKQGGRLPGDKGSSYLRVPALAVLGLAPLLGAAFVVFLPVMGFTLLAYTGVEKVSSLLRKDISQESL